MRILLLDLEGVVVDTTAARAEAHARALADAGVPPEAFDETLAELTALRAERYLAERLGKGITLLPGAREAIGSLAARLALGVVTGLRRREASLVLELAGLEAEVPVVVAADDVRRPRPAPDAHRRALDRLARRAGPPSHGERPAAVALEGTPDGARAARAAGLRVVGVGAAVRALDGLDAWVPGIAAVTYDSLTATPFPAPEHDR